MKISGNFWIHMFLIPIGIAVVAIGIAGPNFKWKSGTASIFLLPTTSFGTTTNFAVIAEDSISSTRNSQITGDVGVSPGIDINGFAGIGRGGTGSINGNVFIGSDPTITQAHTDLTNSYFEAKYGPGNVTTITTDLANLTLEPGIYEASTLNLADGNTLVLDGTDDPTAAFIFRAQKALSIGSNTQIILVNTTACNVFWQSDLAASIGTNSIFNGTVMARDNITLAQGVGTGTTVYGRLLSRKGSILLDDTQIFAPSCSAPTPLPANLIVIKQVSGEGNASDFTINVSGTNVSLPSFQGNSEGTSVTLDAGSYAVTEVSNDNYTATYENCSGTIAAGESKTCTITNTRNTPPENISSTRNTSRTNTNPSFQLEKKSNLATLPGPGFVTYSYFVTNDGDVDLEQIEIRDDKCARISYVSGDQDNDQILGVNEQWAYLCTTYLTKTTENIATVLGDYNGDRVRETARATVTVNTTPVISPVEIVIPVVQPLVTPPLNLPTDSENVPPTPTFPKTGFPPRQ